MGDPVAVVGGGISGLALAWNLQKLLPNSEIRLFERLSEVGGTARTLRDQGYLLETGPNGFLDNRQATLDLCTEVGLSNQLIRAKPAAKARFIFLGDRLRELPSSPAGFLRSDLLSLRGKLRVLAERFISPRLSEEDESIYAFGCRRIGREATENLLDAFVTGILAGDYELLSLPACFPRMREMEQKHGGLFRAMRAVAAQRRKEAKSSTAPMGSPQGTLTTLRGGMGQLMHALADRLATPPVVGCDVHRLFSKGNTWEIGLADGNSFDAPSVVLTTPAPVQARLLEEIDTELARTIRGIPYSSAVVVVVGFSERDLPAIPKGFGYLAPERLGRPVLGVIFSSAIFPDQAPPGHFAFRAILGGWRRPDVIDWPEEKIEEAVADDLKATLGITARPSFIWMQRWRHAIPQYHVGHLDREARIEQRLSRHPGLFLAGNAHRGVALNDCIADAARVAESVATYLSMNRSSSQNL